MPLFINAEIVEVANFQEITSHIQSDTLVLLDIDDTLLIPVQMLGCDEWFMSRLQFHQKSMENGSQALEKSLAEWEGIRHLTQMELVEPTTNALIQTLQTQGYCVMGLYPTRS